MAKIRKAEFEDQTLIEFSLAKGNIHLAISCWNEDANTSKIVSVDFVDCKKIKINNKDNDAIVMLSDDGEIIHFEIENNKMLLIVIWHSLQNKGNDTTIYKFDFRDIVTIKSGA